MSRGRAQAEIAQDKRGELYVKVTLADGRRIEAYKTDRGVQYDKPEWVPRYLKQSVVPDLFKEIRRRILQGAT